MFRLTYGPTFMGIRPGEMVTYSTPQGQTRRGRAVLADSDHVVVNAGGRHGTPQVVNSKNYLGHTVTGTKSK